MAEACLEAVASVAADRALCVRPPGANRRERGKGGAVLDSWPLGPFPEGASARGPVTAFWQTFHRES
jgi:hypothetical protein